MNIVLLSAWYIDDFPREIAVPFKDKGGVASIWAEIHPGLAAKWDFRHLRHARSNCLLHLTKILHQISESRFLKSSEDGVRNVLSMTKWGHPWWQLRAALLATLLVRICPGVTEIQQHPAAQPGLQDVLSVRSVVREHGGPHPRCLPGKWPVTTPVTTESHEHTEFCRSSAAEATLQDLLASRTMLRERGGESQQHPPAGAWLACMRCRCNIALTSSLRDGNFAVGCCQSSFCELRLAFVVFRLERVHCLQASSESTA